MKRGGIVLFTVTLLWHGKCLADEGEQCYSVFMNQIYVIHTYIHTYIYMQFTYIHINARDVKLFVFELRLDFVLSHGSIVGSHIPDLLEGKAQPRNFKIYPC